MALLLTTPAAPDSQKRLWALTASQSSTKSTHSWLKTRQSQGDFVLGRGIVSRQYDFIFILCLPFSFLFFYLWTSRDLFRHRSHVSHMMGHLTYHMTWAHDQSRDHGHLFLLHMSHYDSLIVF